jgi:glycosyltransferase involved in cell wall biosynthesis
MLSSLKIIVPTSSSSIGGHVSIATELGATFKELGVKVETVFIDFSIDKNIIQRIAFIASSCFKLLGRSSNDHLLCLGKEPAVIMLLIKKLTGSSNKILMYSMTHNSSHLNKKGVVAGVFFRLIYAIVFRYVDLVWSHSFSMKRDLEEYFFVDKDKSIVSYPCIQDYFFENYPTVKRSVSVKSRMLFVGRLEKEKQVFSFIESFNFLDNELVLYIVGDGSELERIKDLIDQKKLESRVFLLGAQKHIRDLLDTVDLLVLPSLFEGFGLVLAEAHSRGVPTVCFQLPGPDEIVIDGCNGILVGINDFEAFRLGIFKCLKTNFNKEKIIQSSHRFSKNLLLDFLSRSFAAF